MKKTLIVAALAFGVTAAYAEKLRFHGTIGQQAATLTVNVDGDSITEAMYRYDKASRDVMLVEARTYGNTAVFADDDGNVFHLHFQSLDGVAVKDLPAAARLSGTMDRSEINLPVDLIAVK